MERSQIELLVIDGQNGFLKESLQELYVPGAEKDSEKVAALIDKGVDRLDDLHFTLDSHHLLHIANPLMWINRNGEHPAPFTMITADEARDGIWRINILDPDLVKKGIKYLEYLEKQGRYVLTIWNPHCLIGSEGHNIHQPMLEAMYRWETKNVATSNKWTKGSNVWTEHYSAVQACKVEDDDLQNTGLNMSLIETLQDADVILLAGWALNFCVASTVIDISTKFDEGDPNFTNTKKMILLEDCTSPIPDQPGETLMKKMTDDFMNEMIGRGMQVAKSTDSNIL